MDKGENKRIISSWISRKEILRMGDGWNWIRIVSNDGLWYLELNYDARLTKSIYNNYIILLPSELITLLCINGGHITKKYNWGVFPSSRFLLQKLTVTQQVKKFLFFYETRRIITV
jgi:hypothetical protein